MFANRRIAEGVSRVFFGRKVQKLLAVKTSQGSGIKVFYIKWGFRLEIRSSPIPILWSMADETVSLMYISGRTISGDGDSPAPSFFRPVIPEGPMLDAAVVPENEVVFLPAETDLEVDVLNVPEEQF